MSLRSKVRRHRDTKRQSGLPNLLLALSVSTTSAYSNLGVSKGFEPLTSATNSISLPLSQRSRLARGEEVGGRGGMMDEPRPLGEIERNDRRGGVMVIAPEDGVADTNPTAAEGGG
jgi:hypothetical protein